MNISRTFNNYLQKTFNYQCKLGIDLSLVRVGSEVQFFSAKQIPLFAHYLNYDLVDNFKKFELIYLAIAKDEVQAGDIAFKM